MQARLMPERTVLYHTNKHTHSPNVKCKVNITAAVYLN